MINFIKRYLNSTALTAGMKPLDQLITSGSAPVLNVVTPTAPVLANSQVFTASGTFTAPKTGVFYVTLIGRGGNGGAGGNYAQNGGYYNFGGYGGAGGSGYVKFRVPVAMTAGQQTVATIGTNTTFGSMTVANGTNGSSGQSAYSSSGGRGGDGGKGAIPGDGGYIGNGHGDTPDGAPGAAGTSSAQPFPFILSPDGRQVLSVFGLPDLLAANIFNGGGGGNGGQNPDYPGGAGSPGKPGAVIIEWD